MDIAVRNLYKSYGEKQVFTDFNAVFEEGSATALMGESGCGKTTLLRILTGLETADEGTLLGLENARISAVFQEDRLCEEFSAFSNVKLACPPGVDSGVIKEHLEAVGLGESIDLPVSRLSGGMKRRVAIVRAVLVPKTLLLLDEPFSGLDKQNKRLLAEHIKLRCAGITLVVVTHDREEAQLLGAKIIKMHTNEGN